MSASAIIDRLVHHAHLFVINGSSYQLKDKLKKGGECSASKGAEEKEENNNFPGKRRKEVLAEHEKKQTTFLFSQAGGNAGKVL